MNRSEIIAKLKALMTENLELAEIGDLKESDRLFEDLGIDSIMVLQLVVYIEESFGLSVPEDGVDPAAYGTVGSLVDFIRGLQEERV